MAMHDGELAIDAALVAELVAEQLPHLGDLAIREIRSSGTVNAIFGLGPELYARLPRMPHWASDLEKECRWLPTLAPRLSLRVPEPAALGRPTSAYPLPWAVYRWIEGEPYSSEPLTDERRAAQDLARFVTELRAAGPAVGAPPAGRRPLRELDAATRAALAAADGIIDAAAATSAWERALQAPPWDGTAAWIHGDLLRPNLLVAGGRLRAVLDFGSVGVGDPATDLVAAWAVFGPRGREAYRAALAPDDGAWERGRGIALHQAALIIPYYTDTNPAFAALATRTVEEILSDAASDR